MSFPKYPAYKKTALGWVEDLPAEWNFVSLRRISRRYSGGTPDKKNIDYWTEGTIPWLNSGAVNDFLITQPSDWITLEAFENSSAKWIPAGSLVIALAGQGKTKGMTAQVAIDTTCNQSMAAIIPNQRCEPRFLLWWLTANYQNIRNMAGGDLRDGLNLDHIGMIPCPLPSLDEQQIIIDFLDRETAKIDALIAEQQRLIELLQEKRQAVISHAVTKGLNPDAPMKDSGVEWLGQVPTHWKITSIKYILKMKSGGTPSKERLDFWEGGDIPWASSKDLKKDYLDDTADHITSLACLEGGAEILSPECVLVSVRGMILAHTFPVVRPLVPLAINQDLKALLPEPLISPDYLAKLLQGLSPEILSRVDEAAHGTKVLRIPDFNSLLIAIPCIDEQKEILSKLNKELQNLSKLTGSVLQAISLLQERRSALISAAVTGQIDVRELAEAVA